MCSTLALVVNNYRKLTPQNYSILCNFILFAIWRLNKQIAKEGFKVRNTFRGTFKGKGLICIA